MYIWASFLISTQRKIAAFSDVGWMLTFEVWEAAYYLTRQDLISTSILPYNLRYITMLALILYSHVPLRISIELPVMNPSCNTHLARAISVKVMGKTRDIAL